jgi:hypothetical protein
MTSGVEYAKNVAGRTSLHLFPQPVIEKRGGDGFLGAGLVKKQVLYRHAWSFKPKNHYKSLLGPYEGKLQ